jgi:hypothetical protein
MGASVGAAIIIRKERKLVDHFRSVGAVSADTARTLAQLGVDQHIAWRRLVDLAVLRSTPGGAWYLDEPSFQAINRVRRRLAVAFTLLVVIVGLTAFLAGTLGAHH